MVQLMKTSLLASQAFFWWYGLSNYFFCCNVLFPADVICPDKFNKGLIEWWCSVNMDMMRRFLQMDITWEGDEIQDEDKDSAIFICNHRHELDGLFIWDMLLRSGVHNTRFVSKAEVRRIPTAGWITGMMDTVYLQRDWEQDKEYLEQYFEKHGKGGNYMIFPEGTVFDPEIRDRRNERDGLTYERVMGPKHRGFKSLLDKSGAKAVYDITLRFTDIPWDKYFLEHMVKGQLTQQVEMVVERLDAPTENVEQWLDERFEKKDQLLARPFEGVKTRSWKPWTTGLVVTMGVGLSMFGMRNPKYLVYLAASTGYFVIKNW